LDYLVCSFHGRKAKERDWSSQGKGASNLWVFLTFVSKDFGISSWFPLVELDAFGLVLCEQLAGILCLIRQLKLVIFVA